MTAPRARWTLLVMGSRLAVLGVLWLLAGCQPATPPGGAPRPTAAPTTAPARTVTAAASHAPEGAPAGIDWFHGDVAQALARAKREGRPVLLFWGAQWCPFCHTLKATVFPRPDFIAKTRLFLPVYLDGDDPGAQRWGEQFAVRGYPTLVLLDPQGHELLRLGAGRDVAEYAAMLDLALAQVQPVETLLARASANEPLSAEQCHRLAYNGWELDAPEPAALAARARALAAAARACPADARLDRARLLINATAAAADAPRASLPATQLRPMLDAVE